jgi:hypothetical protein
MIKIRQGRLSVLVLILSREDHIVKDEVPTSMEKFAVSHNNHAEIEDANEYVQKIFTSRKKSY